jgi:hypothetical protein
VSLLFRTAQRTGPPISLKVVGAGAGGREMDSRKAPNSIITRPSRPAIKGQAAMLSVRLGPLP